MFKTGIYLILHNGKIKRKFAIYPLADFSDFDTAELAAGRIQIHSVFCSLLSGLWPLSSAHCPLLHIKNNGGSQSLIRLNDF